MANATENHVLIEVTGSHGSSFDKLRKKAQQLAQANGAKVKVILDERPGGMNGFYEPRVFVNGKACERFAETNVEELESLVKGRAGQTGGELSLEDRFATVDVAKTLEGFGAGYSGRVVEDRATGKHLLLVENAAGSIALAEL